MAYVTIWYRLSRELQQQASDGQVGRMKEVIGILSYDPGPKNTSLKNLFKTIFSKISLCSTSGF